jgi:hypothetical protein
MGQLKIRGQITLAQDVCGDSDGLSAVIVARLFEFLSYKY